MLKGVGCVLGLEAGFRTSVSKTCGSKLSGDRETRME